MNFFLIAPFPDHCLLTKSTIFVILRFWVPASVHATQANWILIELISPNYNKTHEGITFDRYNDM